MDDIEKYYVKRCASFQGTHFKTIGELELQSGNIQFG